MRIKFLNINIFLGGIYFEPLMDFLKKENPDILSMQEVYNGNNEKLEKRFRAFSLIKQNLNYDHTFFSPAFSETVNGVFLEQGNAIMSRFPITKTDTMFYDVPYKKRDGYLNNPEGFPYIPRNLQHAVIDVNGTELNIFNTQGIWGTDGKDNERRAKMSETIIKSFTGLNNVILSGDFNVDINTQAMGNIQKYLTNVFDKELTSSFNIKLKKDYFKNIDVTGFSTAVVDMIFVSPSIKIVEHYSPEADVSDHKPLVSILDIE